MGALGSWRDPQTSQVQSLQTGTYFFSPCGLCPPQLITTPFRSVSVTPTTINPVAQTRNLGDIGYASFLLLHFTAHKIQCIPLTTALNRHSSPSSWPVPAPGASPLLPGFLRPRQAALPASPASIPALQSGLGEAFLMQSLSLKSSYSFSAPPCTWSMRSYLFAS